MNEHDLAETIKGIKKAKDLLKNRFNDSNSWTVDLANIYSNTLVILSKTNNEISLRLCVEGEDGGMETFYDTNSEKDMTEFFKVFDSVAEEAKQFKQLLEINELISPDDPQFQIPN